MQLEPLFDFEGEYVENTASLEGGAGSSAWIATARGTVSGPMIQGQITWTSEARPGPEGSWTATNAGVIESDAGELIGVTFDGLTSEIVTPGVFRGTFRWRFSADDDAHRWLNDAFAVGETRSVEDDQHRAIISGRVFVVRGEM